MITYLVRRILLMFPTLIGITLVVFLVMAASPGGISAQHLIEGQNLEPQAKKALEDYYNRLYGLDQPAPLQYLRWLNNISPAGFTFDENHRLTGFSLFKGSDLGTSFRFGRPVLDLVAERVPITLLLNLLSLPLVYAVAIGIGVRAARERGGAFDVVSGGVMLALWSVPTMLAGILLLGFFASEQYWHWFPTAGLNRREALDMAFLPHLAPPAGRARPARRDVGRHGPPRRGGALVAVARSRRGDGGAGGRTRLRDGECASGRRRRARPCGADAGARAGRWAPSRVSRGARSAPGDSGCSGSCSAPGSAATGAGTSGPAASSPTGSCISCCR